MTPSSILWLMLAGYGVGALGCLLARFSSAAANIVAHLGMLIGAISGVALALGGIASGNVLRVALPRLFPFATMSLALDGLGAYFLLVISVVAVAAAIYGPAYLAAHGGASPPVVAAGINVFVGSMALVVCAGDALTFLLAWEGMTLASYALVVSEGTDENARAGLVYIVMAHAGTAMVTVVLLVLVARANSFDLDALRAASANLGDRERTVLFFLALAGLAAKAGIVPLHVWLPEAHPAAPSHVSALMSGVMLKVAVYAIIRFGMDLLAPAGSLPPAWGWTVLVLGTISAVVGVLYALQQHDLKRLLAFHSVENVGIILMGVGLGMLLWRRGGAMDALAVLAFAAALLHTLNHAAFKGLLFLGAGSVLAGTHVRNIEELGGLARKMPWTAWLFLLGAVAISALPPLNGFVSEWMTFQALVLAGAALHGAAGLAAVMAASMLALTGALAAACFVKAFGVTFLGRPRSPHAEHARESPPSMRAGMLLLAAVCVLVGILPGHAMKLLDAPVRAVLGGGASAVVATRGPLVLSAGREHVGTALSMGGAAALFAGLVVVSWLAFGRGRLRTAPTWTCGMLPSSRFDYTATAFAKSLRVIFAMLYRPRRQIEKEARTPYVVTRLRWHGEVVDLAGSELYDRILSGVMRVSHGLRDRSTGHVHGYIGFLLVTLLVTLVVFGRG